MKYKLIKEYPGSLKLGTKVSYSEDNKIYNFNGGNFYSELPKNQVENLPEFWEKIIEKDYLITGYYQNLNNIHINITGNFSKSFETEYKIYQVKRLSDGEIFTIGDNISSNLLQNSPFILTSIELEKDGNLTYLRGYGRSNFFKNAYKAKTPLFTTEDGVDIFEGDEIFGVNNSWEVFLPHFTDLQNKIKSWGIKPIFSTKETAEEYILMNKPCLSFNDVINYIHEEFVDKLKTRDAYPHLEKIVKSKL